MRFAVGLCLAWALACSRGGDEAGGAAAAGSSAAGSSGAAGSAGIGGSSMGGSSGAAGATGVSGAGGAEDGGPRDAGSAVDEACAHLARVTCQKYRACLPWYVPLNFGDIDTCIEQYAATQCRNRVGVEDSSETVVTTEACAAARSAATCAQWFDEDVVVSACLPRPGTRPAGAACGTASQCQSMNCVIPVGMECGRCGGPLVGDGGGCVQSSECASNMRCIDQVCGPRRGLGQRCPNVDGCQYDLACWYGECVVGSSNAGEPCDRNTACKPRIGVVCDNGVCNPWQFAGPGEPCTPSSTFCAAGDCTMVGERNVCVAAPREGEACDHFANRFCLPSEICVGGFCKRPDISRCR